MQHADADPPDLFKIVSLNVAGLRASWKKGLPDYVAYSDPDVFCIQETKMSATCRPSIEDLQLKGYHGYFLHAAKKGYSGTAVYTRIRPASVGRLRGVTDPNGRCLVVEFARFFIVNVYVVNAGAELGQLEPKLSQFWPQLIRQLEEMKRRKPVILLGDLNVSHQTIDIYRAAGHEQTAGFTAQERRQFGEFLASGWVDSFRTLHPGMRSFTYFDYGGAKMRGEGWRLDYFVVDRESWESGVVVESMIDATPQLSDHVPITLLLRRERLLDRVHDLADDGGVCTDVSEQEAPPPRAAAINWLADD